MVFRFFRTISPRSRNPPLGCIPVSSPDSRIAAASGSSGFSYSTFGIVHAPASFLAQYGPPGCTSSTRGLLSASL